MINEMETEKQPCLPFLDPIKLLKENSHKKESSDTVKIKNLREEQRIIDGIGDVFGKLYKDLKLDKLILGTHKDEQWNDILESCARVAFNTLSRPSSRHCPRVSKPTFSMPITTRRSWKTICMG